MKIYDLNECKTYFRSRYSYLTDNDIELMYDIASDRFVNLRYPFNLGVTDIPQKELQKHPTWHLRFIQWYIESAGISNVIGYSENGVSWKYDKAGLPQDLIDEIVSCVG